ncbi:uncharacterized protein LOC132727630 [Ruditapes philippinarum]|uniref:uncharacterized protein LOC132727630 n=1 Tax=Ruditapes philippinarum TaxID=129788 RepID=UPI00295B12C0|nr:uncharacterized protein LOC132727630 [Ruditapes philippinarum]
MSTAVFCLRTEDLSWQDRTINIEFMVAPAKSQLLYNKHKGLKTKFEQESYYLDREKESFMKSFKTERRLLERKKERYSKRRNDIIIRRASGDSRRRFSITGRISAPPRLEQEKSTESKENMKTFITETPLRISKSAGARTRSKDLEDLSYKQTTEKHQALLAPVTPDIRAISPCVSTRTNTPGRPYLQREKSVRFQNLGLGQTDDEKETHRVDTPIQDRIKNFLDKQTDFNKSGPTIVTDKNGRMQKMDTRVLARRRSSVHLNMSKLEDAFNDFCIDGTTDGFDKLVKYTTKMRAGVKNARNSFLIPNSPCQ